MGHTDFQGRYKDSYFGTYRIFLDNFIPVDFLRPEQVISSGLEGYKLLCLSFTYCIDQETADIVMEFVKKGGNVVAESICAAFSERGKPYYYLLGARFSDLFGCSVTGMNHFKYWLVGHPVTPTVQGADVLGQKRVHILVLWGKGAFEIRR